MGRKSRFSEEVCERAVRRLGDYGSECGSQWEPIGSIAAQIGCSAETRRKWVVRSEIDSGRRVGISSEELARVKELERKHRELRRANEILRKASAYFAQAELDRRPKEWSGSSTIPSKCTG